MSRLVFLAILAALGSAFFLYGIKHDTRALEARVQERERAVERAQSDIAVLRAERAHLARPERIEPIARSWGLKPPAPQQVVRGILPPGMPSTGALIGERPGERSAR